MNVNSSDPPLAAIGTTYSPAPLAALFHPVVELAAWGPCADSTKIVNLAAIRFAVLPRIEAMLHIQLEPGGDFQRRSDHLRHVPSQIVAFDVPLACLSTRRLDQKECPGGCPRCALAAQLGSVPRTGGGARASPPAP
jgi:hypothetical protein